MCIYGGLMEDFFMKERIIVVDEKRKKNRN